MSYIKIYDTIEKSEPITKGWSDDKKYCVTTTDGNKYLLRVTSVSRYETRKSLFSMMEQVAALDIPMCKPVEFGTCDDGVYSIQSWIDGEDLETLLSELSETEQYVLGWKSGEILRRMHNIFVSDIQSERPDWAESFDHTTDERIRKYRECGLRFKNDGKVIDYLEENRHLIESRPRCFQHGDYSVRNMMLENGELKIIDFERLYFGDPWEDFTFVMLDAVKNPYFATGQIRGYFDAPLSNGSEPPQEFFNTYAFYVYSSLLSGIYESVSSGADEINRMLKQTQDISDWFDDMRNPVPTWYLKDFYIQWIDGVPYKLKAPFDFSFMSKYGKVFKVFDEQGSGNISFGVQNGEKKYFIKFAGAPRENYIAHRDSGEIDTVSAIMLLKAAVSLYTELAHPTLIKFITAEETGGGYAAVFEWENAMGIDPLNSRNYIKFMQMPTEKKIKAFEDIMGFHAHVAAKDYVALDFYNGSIMYDYDREKVVVCDIDLYQKSPFQNIGNWEIIGSERYVSPEECAKDAIIDEITNVYTMGATAFSLFASGDRSPEAWTLSKPLYDVVKKAVSGERNKRQQSIEQLIAEWRAAK